MLRVLHCIETVASGGVERTRLLLARGLDPGRFEQQLLCTQAAGPIASEMQRAGMQVHEIGVFRGIADPARYMRALRRVRAFRPHIVHGAVFEGNAAAMIAGGIARVPVRIAEETSDPANRSWRGDRLIHAIYGLADAVVGVSGAVAGYLARLGVPARKIVTIENSAAVPRPVTAGERARLRGDLSLAAGDLVVGTVCRLSGEKRVGDLIDAVAVVARHLPAVRLLVVGDGPDRAALEARARSAGIERLCRFVGYRHDTAPYYAAMDLFVLASGREAFGLVLAEAMLAGVPVIASAVGGIPAVLDGGRAGVLVAPGNPERLADTVRALLSDPARRAYLAATARSRAEERYLPARYVADVAALYERLWAQRRR